MEIYFTEKRFLQFSFYISIFLLLEWLYPFLSMLPNLQQGIGLLFIILLTSLNTINCPLWLRLVSGTVFIMVSLFFITDQSLIVDDFFLLINLQITSISLVTRLILVLLIIWFLIDIVIKNFVNHSYFFIWFILTVSYVVSLDLFTSYDGKFSFIRVVCLGFIYLGVRTFYKNIRDTKVSFRSKRDFLWFIFLVCFLMMLTISGFLLPKLEQPLTHLKTMIDSNQTLPLGDEKKLGLKEDDHLLGGPLIADDTVIFQAISTTNQLGYFRVESKDYYTGMGWETTELLVEPPANMFSQMIKQLPESKIEAREQQVEINSLSNSLFIPYQNFSLKLNELSFMDATSNYNRVIVDEKQERLVNSFYQIRMDKELLRESLEPELKIKTTYTQLPTTLPQEVKDLAEEWTSGLTNSLDRVLAIEEQLKSGLFTYEISDIPFANKEVDYVYEFLFETRRGYCVNFSTAMVVLLRSIDIPAIWVKGYTQGDRTTTSLDGNYVYTITNNHAHAWVEVYFEGIGWIPFDPTPGFQTNLELVDRVDSNKELSTPVSPIEKNEKKDEQLKEVTSKDSYVNWIIFVCILFIVVLLVLMNRLKRKGLPYYYIYRVKKQPTHQAPKLALSYLLDYLKIHGLVKESSETLEEFFTRVEEKSGNLDLGPLLLFYNNWLYGEGDLISFDEIYSKWKEILKKMSTWH